MYDFQVLDEIYHILYRIRNDQTPPRPHELLTELRDISSMAMEHFEEKIVPILRGRIRTEEAEINNGAGEYSGGLPDQQATAGGTISTFVHYTNIHGHTYYR